MEFHTGCVPTGRFFNNIFAKIPELIKFDSKVGTPFGE